MRTLSFTRIASVIWCRDCIIIPTLTRLSPAHSGYILLSVESGKHEVMREQEGSKRGRRRGRERGAARHSS